MEEFSNNDKIADHVAGIKDTAPKPTGESNQILSDFEYSVGVAANFEPRRSSRNIQSKDKAAINYVNYVPPPKSSSGKKKLAILRDQLILVHRNPLDYNYRWDLESFGEVHDVDMNTMVHGEIGILLSNAFAKK